MTTLPPFTAQFPLLLIEPDPIQRQLLSKALARSLHGRYRICATAQDALHALDSALEPHLVVTAPQLPDMDTVSLLGQLRGHPRTRGLPVTLWGRRSERPAVPGSLLLSRAARWLDRGETLGEYLNGLHALLDACTPQRLSA